MSRSVKMFAALVVLCGAGLAALLMIATDWGTSPVFHTEHIGTVSPAESSPYTVSMSPMGEVRFEHVPRRVVTWDANYNDMLVALGQESKLIATGYQHNFFDGFYAQIPGVKIAIDPLQLIYLFGSSGSMFDKELLYALRADVHHIDPLRLASSPSWTRADVEEIARNVGPFFANRYSRENSYPGKDPYEYYTIWELSDKVAQVYRCPERIARLKAVHDKLVAYIQAHLPPENKRPRVGLVFYKNGKFLPFSLSREGFGQAQYRAVGARDAFESIKAITYADAGRGKWLDLEGLLTLNPDVLIVPWAIYPKYRSSYEQLLSDLKSDPLARRLSAFREGRVYPGGTPLQGPIFYLFQIEMAAKQIYPDIFGPYRDDQQYPPQEQLFDRALLADILKNNEE